MKVLIIGHEEAAKLLPMAECIQVMEDLFRTLARGDAVQPLRSSVWEPSHKGRLGLMPAYLGSPRVIGGKFITFFPSNQPPFESHQGAVLLYDPDNGQLLCMVDATTVTKIRTAAASALATRILAREDATDLAILGSGTQAVMHLESMQVVRKITRVRVWSRTPAHAQAFANSQSTDRLKIEAADSAEAAVRGAEIVCTTTAATKPVLEGRWLSPGAHVNAIGASVPPFRELDSEAIARGRLYTDRRESLFNEADDFRIPKQEGVIDDGHLIGEIGEVLIGKTPGRSSSSQITIFKSLGLAVEDLAAGHHIYRQGMERGIGTWVEFGGER